MDTEPFALDFVLKPIRRRIRVTLHRRGRPRRKWRRTVGSDRSTDAISALYKMMDERGLSAAEQHSVREGRHYLYYFRMRVVP